MALVAIVAPVSGRLAGAGRLEEQFRAEAPKAWAEAKQNTARLYIELARESKGRSATPIEERSRVIVKVRDGMMLVEKRETGPDGRSSRESVRAVNAEQSFHLMRKATDRWVVAEIGPAKAETIRSLLELDGRSCVLFPWYVADQSFPELCSSPQFVLKEVISVQRDGREFMRVGFDCAPRENRGRVLLGGWVVLDPRRSWCLVEYEVQLQYRGGARSTARCKTSYAQDHQDSAVPISARFELGDGNSGVDTDLVFVRYEVQDVPETDFTMAAYGIKVSSPPRVAPGVLVVVSLALVALFIAVVLYWQSRRKVSDKPPHPPAPAFDDRSSAR